MDEEEEEKLRLAVSHLKSPSKTLVYNALVAIRTKFIKESGGVARFRQHGGLQPLLHHLQKPNVKIVELALSILGNCCLEMETREAVRRYGGIQHVVKILECIDKDSVLNRACRTLANLALDHRNAEQIHDRNGIKLLLDLLASATDSNLKLSALRALRLLSNTPAHREKANELGGTECLVKLVAPKEEEGEGGEHSDVMLSVLRGLVTLTTECSANCARQMQNVEYLEKLVCCARESTAAQLRETSLHVLANLMKQETLRPVLGSAGVVTVLIAEVAKWEKASSGWQWSVDALCQCTREAINRFRVRKEGGLRHLVLLLKDEDDERLWLCALSSLVNFLYDDTGFGALVDLGLVPALVKRFESLASREPRVVHGRPVSPPPFSPLPPLPQTVTDSRRSGVRQIGGAGRFPGSASGCGCFSPDCSPPYWTSFPRLSSPVTSPASAFSPRLRFPPEHRDPADDLCYSPVHEWDDSDEEAGAKENSSSSKGTASLPGWESPRASSALERNADLEEEEDVLGRSEDEEDATAGPGDGRSPLSDILLLFSRLSMQENPCPSLLHSGAFAALLEYVTETDRPHSRAKRCLFRTVRNALCFEHLVLHRVPTHIFERLVNTPHEPADCVACSYAADLGRALATDLRLQAESAFGSGVILHLLLGKSDEKQKLSASVAAAYLLRSAHARRKIFVDSVGLGPLTSSLDNGCDDGELDEAIKGFSHLVKTVLPPEDYRSKEDEEENPAGPCPYEVAISKSGTGSEEVVLRADGQEAGGEGARAVRAVLCSQSEVFEAMFNGYFVESGRRDVVIRDASPEALEVLVHFLHSCRSCPLLQVASRSAALLLEVLVLADKFLLERLKDSVVGDLMRLRPLGVEDFARILSASKMVGCPGLGRWAHARLLTSDAPDRRTLFRELVSADARLPSDLNAFLMAELSLCTQ